jgi:hypothetical protein
VRSTENPVPSTVSDTESIDRSARTTLLLRFSPSATRRH